MRIASAGHVAFALALIGIGLLGLASGDFTPTWSGVPDWVPAHVALAYLCAAVSLAGGVGLLWRRTAAAASRVLLVAFLAWLLLVRVPLIVRHPATTVSWWACGDTAVMLGAAWVLYVWFAGEADQQRVTFPTGERGLRIARTLFGLALIPFGIAHFTFLERTVFFVPHWLPWRTAWAMATGCAFIAAGVAVVSGVRGRLAATLLAWMLGLFTLIVWVPIVLAHPSAGDWAEFVSSCVLTAGAWMVADSWRGTPSLGRGLQGAP